MCRHELQYGIRQVVKQYSAHRDMELSEKSQGHEPGVIDHLLVLPNHLVNIVIDDSPT